MDTSEINNIVYLKTLLSIEGIGPQRILALKNKFQSFENVFESSANSLLEVDGINLLIAKKILSQKNNLNVIKLIHEEEVIQLEKENARLITYWDLEYPRLLKEIYYPPIIIYVKGNIELSNDKSIAIVGTRNPSYYGRTNAELFTKGLSENNLTITSGLARGIDTIAHTTALKANGKTIAVIGCGLDVSYPPENKKLMHEIEENGLIISEFPLRTKPDAQNFPRRNRIISGLSLGVLLVETKINGGALHTAAYALDQGRDIFAIPGNINSSLSSGCNFLIKKCEAKLVTTVEDILNDMKFDSKFTHIAAAPPVQLNLFEEKIMANLSSQPIQIDNIANQTGLTTADCSVHLLTLELKGQIKQLPGKQFVAI